MKIIEHKNNNLYFKNKFSETTNTIVLCHVIILQVGTEYLLRKTIYF